MNASCRLAVLLSLAFATPAIAADTAPDTDPEAPVAPASANPETVSLKDIQTFAAVLHAVRAAYVEPTDSHQLIESAIRGMLQGLDPHSEFLDASSLDELDEQTSGAYAGLGVEVVAVDGVLRVIAPMDDTPASRAGIRPGDAIVRLDDTVITAENADQAVDNLRGKPGSNVRLTIRRDGSDGTQELALRREVIKVASVKARVLEPGYAYVRIAQFQQETGGELREKLRRMSAKGRLSGLVLDLRSNPGGIINAAVEVSDAFLEQGAIVSTRGRVPESESAYSATKGDLLSGAPMVLLIDGGTASAAEIVAGALQDHHRAVIIGTRSFGKGSVQTVMPLDRDRAVKLTTARYYTPKGASIQASGIVPDIELADLRLTRPDGPPVALLSERDLSRHLKGDAESVRAAVAQRDPSLDDDYALNEGLNVLKGLVLARAAMPGTPVAR